MSIPKFSNPHHLAAQETIVSRSACFGYLEVTSTNDSDDQKQRSLRLKNLEDLIQASIESSTSSAPQGASAEQMPFMKMNKKNSKEGDEEEEVCDTAFGAPALLCFR